jgi:hypothetical protein
MISVTLYNRLTIWSIVLTTITTIGIHSSFMNLNNHSVYAQMSTINSNITTPGIMRGPVGIPGMINATNTTSSISLMDTITSALESKINLSLGNATVAAENSLGNNSHVVAAHLGEENGYLVYNILALAPDRSFNRILIDPGNGNIILSEQIPVDQLIKTGMERPRMMVNPPDTMIIRPSGPGMLHALPVPPPATSGPRMELAPAPAPGMYVPK